MENLGIESIQDIDFWRDRTVFVTGATGLVGSWLVKRLVEMQASVVCLVRDWVPHSRLLNSNLLERINIVRGDIRDQALLERILGEYEISLVFHLAAQTIVSIANRNPISTFETNIEGTWCLLEACRRTPLETQIIIASSDKAYGEHPVLPYDESTPLQGCHPYDVSKSCSDLIAQTYARTYGMPIVITRCGNFFGGGDLNWDRLVPGTIRSIIRGTPPIIRSDGKYVRDYFYVEDGVEAYLLLAKYVTTKADAAGEAFNFSYGLEVTVLEIVTMILQLMGSDLKPEIRGEAKHEIYKQSLRATKAQHMLGWEPRFSLTEGLERTIDWYKDYIGGHNA